MGKKEKSREGKMKLVIGAMVLILVVDVVADLTLFIGNYNIVHWAEIAVTAVAWILIIIGLVSLKNKRTEFFRGLVGSLFGILGLAGESYFALMNIRAGLEDKVFLSMKPMFCEYVSDLAMLFVLYMLVRGTGQLIAKAGDMELAKISIKKSNLNPIVALIAMVMIPFGTVFSMPISIIIGSVGIVINGAMRLDMLMYAKNGISVENL